MEKENRSEFGRLLSKYRRRAKDPASKEPLTQARLAELLDVWGNAAGYTHERVSRWEKGGSRGEVIRHDNRQLLVALVLVLHRCGGIGSLAEANALLAAGDYRGLNEAEVTFINSAWLQTAHFAPLSEELSRVEADPLHALIDSPLPALPRRPDDTVPAPFMAPPLPVQGVLGRRELLKTMFERLRLDEQDTVNVPPLALHGLGGIGKTTLAVAFGRSEQIRRLFPDGILWTAVGPTPTIRLLLENWGRALGVDLLPERDEAACRDRLRELLYPRRVLLLVDDVWEIQHGEHFLVAGPYCRTLLTTRESPVAYHLATRERTLKVDLLKSDAALQLLRRLAPEAVAANEKVARQLCKRLEYLPLALTLAGRLLATETDVPTRLQRVTDELLERRPARLQLQQAEGRPGLDVENPVSLQAILGMSVDRLNEIDRQRFAMAGVFGGDPLTWEISLASHVWECTLEQAEETAARFIQRGLVERREDGRYWMHALLADYAAQLMEELGL
ncbi:MAG: hypothetical protein KC425_19900 [Anaerolineales bacterium]|nr:hypothetical protein [Anaerolineales bacterium]